LTITPAQLRGARALLALSQDDLAAASDVAKRTIAAFEAETRTPYARTLAALRAALEERGAIFISENGEGPGVRLRKDKK
jgi:DNA-binding XRE family transcriptional regulator